MLYNSGVCALTDVSISFSGMGEPLPLQHARDASCLWDVQSMASTDVFISWKSRQENELMFGERLEMKEGGMAISLLLGIGRDNRE